MTHRFAPEVIVHLADRFVREASCNPGQSALLFEAEALVAIYWACRAGVSAQVQKVLLTRFRRFTREQRETHAVLVQLVTSFAYRLGDLIMIRNNDGESVTVKGDIVCLYFSVPSKPKDVDLATLTGYVEDCGGFDGDGVAGLYAASARVSPLTVNGFTTPSRPS